MRQSNYTWVDEDDTMVCPYCGTATEIIDPNDWCYADGDEWECDDCGRSCWVRAERTTSFFTSTVRPP